MKGLNSISKLVLMLALTLALAAMPANAAKKAKKGAPDISYENLENQFTADELRDLAAAARESGNTVYLAAILKGLTTYETGRFDIRLELGETYIALQKYNEAIPVLKEASALIPSDEAPHRLLAAIYKENGSDSLRGIHLAKAAFLAQRNWENQYNLAVFHISKGKKAQAGKLLVKTMDLNSAFAPAKFEYAKLMLDKGDTEAAFRKFDEALLIEPKNSRYLAYSAYSANLTNRPGICSEHLNAALKITPKNPTVNYLAGMILLNNGKFSAAETHLREALKYSPADVQTLEALGDALVANFKYKEASGNYLTVWQNAGYSERIAYKLGKALAAAEKFKEAKDFFEAVAAQNPKNGEVFFRLVEVYCELGDIKLANAALERFVAHAAQSPAWYQLAKARIHEAKSEPDLAQSAYFAATALDSENPHISAGLGRMMLRQAEFDAAIGYFDEAAKGDPTNSRLLLSKAKALAGKGELNKAAAVYESIAARCPQSPELYLAVSAIKEEQGNLKDAIKALDHGLAANNGDMNILFALGRLYQATKQYERAVFAYQASINRRTKVNANSIEALRLIGEIYYSKLTDEKKAKDFLKRYVKAGGKDSGVDDMLKKLNAKNRS
ncbi:MAG: tetratricopeptide repeat protein [Chitinispirillia bacterium]|nr:tetratricopeptide repeat protein [Chitinispirillia bacterium]MCL2242738.1 tetratricopeptide repeat protein [Chitinispirillia bacterium]